MQSNAAQIDAMRAGRLHVGGFSTGPTTFAVKTLVVLKGRKVAHTSWSSNSGHMASMALLPKQCLKPGKDYKILFSGKHDQSVLGVNSGDCDAATVASDVFERMAHRGTIKGDDFRVLHRSAAFRISSFAYAQDREAAKAKK